MSLRASDRDRDQTVELLAQAASDGQLTLEEYSERIDVALAAKTQDELGRVVADLQQAHGQLTVSPQATSELSGRTASGLAGPIATGVAGSAAAQSLSTSSEKVRAIMSSEHRRGRWRVPSHMQLRAVMADITLELQEAVLTSHVTVIEASATMASITLIVPEGVEVRLSGSAIMGEKSSHMRHEPVPGAPVVEIHARVLMGSLEVRPPKARQHLRDAAQGTLEA